MKDTNQILSLLAALVPWLRKIPSLATPLHFSPFAGFRPETSKPGTEEELPSAQIFLAHRPAAYLALPLLRFKLST